LTPGRRKEKRNREKEKNTEIISEKIFCEAFVVDIKQPQKAETRLVFSFVVASPSAHLQPPLRPRVSLLVCVVCSVELLSSSIKREIDCEWRLRNKVESKWWVVVLMREGVVLVLLTRRRTSPTKCAPT
jgi:hypothetical protein